MNEYSFLWNAYYKDVPGNARKKFFYNKLFLLLKQKHFEYFKKYFLQPTRTFFNEERFICYLKWT